MNETLIFVGLLLLALPVAWCLLIGGAATVVGIKEHFEQKAWAKARDGALAKRNATDAPEAPNAEP